MTALKRLNEDFALNIPLGTKPTDSERSALKRSYAERIKKKQEEEELAERQYEHYLDLLELYRTVCWICEEFAPKLPWDEWSPDWCTAMRLRTELKEEIELYG